MASPSPSAVASIRARVAALGLNWATADNAAILAALAADTVANPAPRGQVPAPFTAKDLIGAASPAGRANLRPTIDGAAAGLILLQDAPHLGDVLDSYQALGLLSAADAAAMKAILTRTQPDPAWPATVPQVQATLGRPLDLLDVVAARP